jgi:hypothetical protein
VQVLLWHKQRIRKGAVVIQDADHRPILTMSRQIAVTKIAVTAGAVDFANHAATCVRAGLSDTDELVS